MVIGAKITGTGSRLGNQLRTNQYYADYLETNDEWIQVRTGIKQRYIVDDTQSLTTLAYDALKQAIERAEAIPEVIIVATTTADNAFPSCAARLHGMLQLPQSCLALDIGAACNGFIYALKLASMFMQSHSTVAIVGADVMSRLIDSNDRSTAVLFGDGAGAVVLQRTGEDKGFIGFDLGTDGSRAQCLYTDPTIKMNGPEVFANAVRLMSQSIENSLAQASLTSDQLNLIIPHQANIRIINSIQQRLNIDPDKMVKTISEHANTSAASIPLALNTVQDKLSGYVAFCGMGAGLSWGSCIMKL